MYYYGSFFKQYVIMEKNHSIGMFIYFIVPLIGLAMYIKVALKMKDDMDDPPYFSLFFLSYIYGGILILILTSLFWKVSGLIVVLTFFLILGGPIITSIIAIINYPLKEDSKYHKIIFYSSGFYSFIGIIYILVFLLANLF